MNPHAVFKTCGPGELHAALQNAGCRVVDVREPAEFEAESIPGSANIPLSVLERECPKLPAAGTVYLICRSGVRARQAAQRLSARGFGEVRVLEGGMNAWSAAGFSVHRGASKTWSLDRQVRFAAGSLVLAGTLLGFFWNAGFLILSGFVGAGLVFAALTDTCGMGMLLARMPWNRSCSG